MKRPLRISLYALASVVVLVGIIWANLNRSNSPVSDICIVVDYRGNDTLVTAEELRQQLLEAMPDLPARLVKEVREDVVASTVARSPFVKNTTANISVGRCIVVNTEQRRPILRVFCEDKEFYLDDLGRVVPVSFHGDCDVLVGNGHFRQHLTPAFQSLDIQALATDTLRQHYDLVQMWNVAQYLDLNPKYGVLFDQIYVSPEGDLQLVPKVGNHIVTLGDSRQMDRKMANLWAMYHRGMAQTGWNTYRLINLKFSDQVICTKR